MKYIWAENVVRGLKGDSGKKKVVEALKKKKKCNGIL